ncbi:P-loop NTPase fold protein [Comamonas aquatica]|uniref:KAP family P-loop NTPase fold protein n=1 Tax=Comamonas aquatica TaxID=225991 RepID=UPI0004B382B4|nr:P-loop NTPase fold protein [Comamonas aquatica]
MISKEAEIEINNIWFEDKLNRKGYADFLYQVIASAETSEAEDNALIFAIDGEWGTGKSFFINCWMRDLEAKGHLVSRFDAWKNDIVDEPLIGFLSHIYADLERWDKRRKVKLAGQSIKKSQKRLLPIAQELVKGAGVKALGYLVTDEVAKEVAKSIADGAEEVIENEKEDEKEIASFSLHTRLKAHNKNIDLIEAFKAELSKVAEDLVKGGDSSKAPVFIFIDELDRCRPDYAVRLLEVVKHIFNSKGICFVSSVNLSQLNESIKTIYGGNFDADRYLDRFFNHRLKLPEPTITAYISSLEDFKNLRDLKGALLSDSADFDAAYLAFYSKVCSSFRFDLRTIKGLFSRLRICVRILKGNADIFHHDEIVFYLICSIKAGKLDGNEFLTVINDISRDVKELSFYLFLRGKYGFDCSVEKWSDVIETIRKIYQTAGSRNIHANWRDGEQYRLNSLILETFEVQEGYEQIFVSKINNYVEVCRMSGRLDE